MLALIPSILLASVVLRVSLALVSSGNAKNTWSRAAGMLGAFALARHLLPLSGVLLWGPLLFVVELAVTRSLFALTWRRTFAVSVLTLLIYGVINVALFFMGIGWLLVLR